MQNDSAGAMVARTDTAFLTEDCSPTFRVSMVLLTICKHPTELGISLLSHLPQPKDKGATVFRGAYPNADMHIKTQINSWAANMYTGMHTQEQMSMHVHHFMHTPGRVCHLNSRVQCDSGFCVSRDSHIIGH